MLVISRHENERIMIGSDIEICVIRIKPDVVRIGITAPRNVPVHRDEIARLIKIGIPQTPKKGNKPCQP